MNVKDIMRADHEAISTALAKVINEDPINRAELERVCNHVLAKMEVEERLLYPLLNERGGIALSPKIGAVEHNVARGIIDNILKDNDSKDADIKTKLQAMKAGGELYAKMEETSVFGLIDQHLSVQEQEELGNAFKELKQRFGEVSQQTVAAY